MDDPVLRLDQAAASAAFATWAAIDPSRDYLRLEQPVAGNVAVDAPEFAQVLAYLPLFSRTEPAERPAKKYQCPLELVAVQRTHQAIEERLICALLEAQCGGRNVPRRLRGNVVLLVSVETTRLKSARVVKIISGLKKAYPDARLALDFSSPLELNTIGV